MSIFNSVGSLKLIEIPFYEHREVHNYILVCLQRLFPSQPVISGPLQKGWDVSSLIFLGVFLFFFFL